MLIFESIRIRNFRAIKEITFQPKTEGITGIFGPNGQGKTSVLMAVVFALYGETPKNVPISSLRRLGSGTEECSVSVVFSHLGDKVEVIRELRGPKNTAVANIYANGELVSKTSVGEANRWIQRRFGVSAEGFLTAFIIRQKELDMFVRSDPAERKRIIEKLAGVELINNALKAARENEKDSRKTLDLLPGSAENVDNAGTEVTFYEEEEEKAEAELANIRATLTALTATRSQQQTELTELREKETQQTLLNNNITSQQAETSNIDEMLERVSYIQNVEAGETADTLRQQYQTLMPQIQEHVNNIARIQHEQKERQQNITNLKTSIQTNTEKIDAFFSTHDEESIKIQHADLLQTQNQQQKEIDRLETTNADLTSSIDMLQHSSECPTCHTDLKDPAALIQQFTDTIAANSIRIAELHVEIGNQGSHIEQLAKKLNEARIMKELGEGVIEQETALQVSLKALEDLPDVTQLQESLNELEIQKEQIVEQGSKAKAFEKDRADFQSLTERRVRLQENIKRLRAQAAEYSGTPPTARISALSKSLSASEKQYNALSGQTAELSATAREAKIRFANARENYARQFTQWEKKRDLLEAHAQKTLTTDMLDKFRQETVSSIAPELSAHATGLISQMTNGDFTEVRLDEDFKASLVDKYGVERPSSWLSGGEESALALALRLSTAFLVTGGNSDMLWLDEPLTAQDADRRAAILSLIRTLPIQQIIMINHAQEAKDIVDLEVTLGKEE